MNAGRKYFAGLSPETMAKLARIHGGPLPSRAEGGPVINPPTQEIVDDRPAQDGPAWTEADTRTPPPTAAAGAPPVDPAFVAGFGTHGDTNPTQPAANDNAEREEVSNGRALPAYTVPAHWQPATHEVHSQHGYTDEELAPYAGARGQQLEASERAGETSNAIADQQGIRDAAYVNAYSQQAQKFRDDAAALEQRKQNYVEMERRKLDELSLQTQQKVDPEAYWKEKGTFAKVMGAIAIGLGQFGASINGGENTAFKIIQSKIDANIRAQETNISNSRHAYDVGTNLYGRNLDAFGDREKALRATRVNYLDAVGAELDSKLADESLPLQQRQRAQKLREMVAKERADVVGEFMKLSHTQISEAENERFVPQQTVGGGVPKGEAPNLVTLPDGTSVQMPNEKSQNEAIAKMQVLDKVQRMNNDALSLRKQIAGLDPLADRTEYQKIYTRLEDMEESKAAILSKAADQGVLREPEYKRMVEKQTHYTRGVGMFKGIPFYSKSERDVADAAIQAQNKTADEDARAWVKSAGGHIVQRGYASDATGNVKPVTKYTGQDVKPAQGVAPSGARPMDPRQKLPTAAAPVRETTPQAPYMGQLPAGTSANDNSKKKGGRLSTKRIK